MLIGLVVDRDPIFSEDEDCVNNSDAPVSSNDNVIKAEDIGAGSVPQQNSNNDSMTQATIG